MTREEQFFLETISDLILKSQNPTPYNMIRASGLLRQLLLDSNSLLNTINKNYKEKIVFTVTDWDAMFVELGGLPLGVDREKMSYWSTGFYPDEKTKSVDLSLDQFLQLTWARIMGQSLTIKNLIRAYSHKYGGVHIGSELTESEDMIINAKFYILNMSSSDAAMYNAIRVILDAISPLSLRIIKENSMSK